MTPSKHLSKRDLQPHPAHLSGAQTNSQACAKKSGMAVGPGPSRAENERKRLIPAGYLVEKLEKEFLRHFSFKVADKESPIRFGCRRPHLSVDPPSKGRRVVADAPTAHSRETHVSALLGVTDVNVNHARSRPASTCADGLRMLAKRAVC